ncbi:MAG: SCO family protein [Gemmatimonadetes bacterium]|nr:SCO family protein [Gemmatimonadota bacterium]
MIAIRPHTGPTGALRRCAMLAGAVLLACSGGEVEPREPADGLVGVVTPEPLPKPDVPLLDTEGETYSVAEETAGKLTFVFFGYTHCPDVCPIHMANLAAALDHLGRDVRRRVAVVFVTTDPARDTPRRIREWLDRWDRGFVGLRGGEAEVEEIQRSLKLPPSVEEPPREDGGYMVGHAAQVVAFAPDGRTVLYPFGIRQSDWVHDIPLLLGRRGRPPRSDSRRCSGGAAPRRWPGSGRGGRTSGYGSSWPCWSRPTSCCGAGTRPERAPAPPRSPPRWPPSGWRSTGPSGPWPATWRAPTCSCSCWSAWSLRRCCCTPSPRAPGGPGRPAGRPGS